MTQSIIKKVTRRQFNGVAAAVAGTIAAPACSRSVMGDAATATKATTTKPDWAIGFQNTVAHELSTEQMELVHGKVPKDLKGSFYRNGPAIFERNSFHMNHWFGGDGMLQAFRIQDGNVSHQGSIVKTSKYLSDEKQGQFTANGFATTVPYAEPLRGPDDMNVANTSVMSVNNELYTLWEGGSAYQMDPSDLQTIGAKTWGEGLKGMPFSAHPKFETDGSLWNFGQDAFSKRLIVYRIAASGKLENVVLVPDVPGGMIHDFCITDKHLVFVVPSFRAVNNAPTFLDMFAWLPEQAQDVIVLDKNDLTKRRQFELPPGFQFHFGNAYEENGNIVYSACVGNEKFAMQGARDVLKGELPARAESQLATVILKKDGSASIRNTVSELAEHEFPQFNPLYQGKKANFLYTIGKSYSTRAGESAILKHDLNNGDLKFYDYGEDYIVEEHLFLPKASQKSEDDGYLIGTSLNFARQRTQLNILDAKKVESGPIAILELPYHLTLGFHGTWVNAA